jgi:excinuclease ABC subunit A
MEISALHLWISKFSYSRVPATKKELIGQLINSILGKLEALIQLGLGYLCLNRSIPTLSGGERQRVRIANQLTCTLKGLIYILDEPCKGLHYRDITKIIKATKDLIKRENTVIAIEHNKQYIECSDNIIELGPVGGPEGGYLINQSSTQKNARNSKPFVFKQKLEVLDYFEVNNIRFRNINGQNARFPIGGITCITGVSGSGKSTLASVVASCLSKNNNNALGIVQGGKNIRRVIQVNQSPIGKTPRSTIVSYLEIFDEIRTLFSKTDVAKRLKISASSFSMNVKGGRCECCQGTGLQKIELNYLPSSYIICPECEGKRFNDEVLSVEYCGKSIYDILETPIVDIVNVFEKTKKIYPALNSMINLGLGYLKLGQMSMNLSGGEAQRIKLAKALSTSAYGRNLYILDEPTSGLNDVDIDKFIQVLLLLQQNRETIIIIEHNIDFIARVSDYIIDFGLRGGNEGGKIVAQGTPKTVFDNNNSSLYNLDKQLE